MNETKTLCYEDGKTNPNVMKTYHNVLKEIIMLCFFFFRQGRASSEDGSEASGEHTVIFS